MSLRLGSTLENRYRLDRLLGQGGMGAVYRAWDQRLEQWVALKENMMTSAEAQAQFEREAKVLARLRHPNLPRVIDHFVTKDGVQYLVMDYVDGPNLAELLKAQGRLAPEDIRQWLGQVCDALAYLHGQNPPVIHRDIKPQNTKITSDGRVILVDFGLSKVGAGQERTATGALGVTPGFSPPEQYGAGHTDQRSDIYALAATLYALLTGETPPDSVQRAIQNAVLTPPRRLNPALNPALESALLHGLATQPARRPASVRDFQGEVQQALRSAAGNLAPPTRAADVASTGSPPGARPVSTPRPMPPAPAERRRRLPAWAWFSLGVILVLLLLLSAILLAVDGGKEETASVAAPPSSAGQVPPPTSTLAVAAESAESGALRLGDVSTVVVAAEQASPTPAARIVLAPTATSAPAPTRRPAIAAATAPPTARPAPPTDTLLPLPPLAPSTPTPAPPTPTTPPSPTPAPQPQAATTPCPSYLHKPRPGMGLLLIENHLGEPLHIDRVGTGEKWDLPAKQGDMPGRLLLDLSPGQHDFNDNTARGYGHIGVTITPGSAFVSPIWYNDRAEELVYALEIPNGCR